jgi:threonyl-tRNA synthetase
VKEQLIENGLRAEADIRNEKIGYKIREHSNAKTPVILAVGKKEAEEKTVSVRRLGSQNTTVVKLDELINDLKKESLSPID